LIVFDAGALVALARLEAGALVVRQLLRAHAGSCTIHAVNLLEIHYGFERDRGAAYAERMLQLIDRAGVQTRDDLDRAFLKDASHIKAAHKMSLADTFGIALARRLNAPLVSTDHHELDAVDAAGVCRVLFIR